MFIVAIGREKSAKTVLTQCHCRIGPDAMSLPILFMVVVVIVAVAVVVVVP